MAPVLHQIHSGPPSNSVKMLADIIGLELELQEVDYTVYEHKSEEYVKKNPVGAIPTLVDGDFALGDSHAIMVYLLGKYGGDKSESLYPSEPRARAVVDQVLFFDASILFVRVKVVALQSVMEGLKAPTERMLSDLVEAYGMLEAFLSRHQYVAADHLTIADLSIATTMYAAVAIQDLDADKFPKTTAYLKMMKEKPYYKKIAYPGGEFLNLLFQMTWIRNNQ